jgi:hypothetical protein
MSASYELHAIYQEWRRLAEAEREAIRVANWPAVTDCQSAIQKLQPRIMRCTEEARHEWSQVGANGAEDFRKIIGEMIEIEEQNNVLLQDLSQVAKAQYRQLEQSGHNLRQVQRSYAPTPPPAWTSFS